MSRKTIPIEPYIDRLAQAVLLGATYDLAAKYAGISISTFESWRRHAEHAKPGTALARLRQRLEQAEGEAAMHWLRQIEEAAEAGDWRAAAFKLERRYYDQYARQTRVDLNVNIQALIGKVAEKMGLDAAELLAEAQQLLKEDWG